MRQTAEFSKSEYPEIADIICKDVYVDDCLSGAQSHELAKSRADQLEIVLNKGGFTLKGISFSGENPPECLTSDGISISVAGMKWFPKDDVLSLDIDELYFTNKLRGRKLMDEKSRKIPSKLTRRHCASKVAEVFDLSGKVMPIISSMKLDLHNLVQRKLDWDDAIPENLHSLWKSNFEMIQELKSLRYNRAIVPNDAASLDINTIDFGDANQLMACSAVYARFERQNGEFSCQLVLARSKIIPEGTSQPRAELIAALLNTHTGEVVRKSFGIRHKGHLKLSDSQIVLYWLKNEEKPLKQWVRNRVLEIRRFTDITDWYHVDGTNMIADMGTRRGTLVNDVNQSSTWINGFMWMNHIIDEMPIKTVNKISLNCDDISEVKNETPCNVPDITVNSNELMLQRDEMLKRHELSNYIVNPNKHRFEVVVRILAIVLKVIKCLKKKSKSTNKQYSDDKFHLSEDEIRESKTYFFKKATMEVKKFNKQTFYSKFSQEKNGVLWYTGRILPTDEVTIVGRFTKAMKDLSESTFCVSVIDKHSPIAYSIVNDIHWHDKDVKHCGVETVWRQVLKVVFIIEGRGIVKSFRRSCDRCRYLNKKSIEVAMGPISPFNMTIAPAFYISQVDLAGPFQAFSQHHKRTTIKVWMAVFCCCTTSAVSLKLMEDYSSSAFVQAFIRLSCEVGYPKILLPDEGSQLLKSCENMMYNYKDVKNKLYVDAKVEFDACPVGGHNIHGRVERKIREVKSSIKKSFQNERLSVMQWETVAAEVANCINDMPLALGNTVSDFEIIDLITPNRLKLGRNNNRSPEGALNVSSDPDKFIKSNLKIFDSWFEVWLMCHVPVLMYQPKWFVTSHNFKEGDIILFLKQESSLQCKYQYGMIDSVFVDKDGVVRKANVKYRNANEKTDRQTFRSVRELIVIHGVDEINIIQELGEIAIIADLKYRNQLIDT